MSLNSFKYKDGKIDLEGGLEIEASGANLGGPNDVTGLPAQMSDDWVEYVRAKLAQSGKPIFPI